MLVTFISQCEKKALKRTRRILDAFANRIGDNTWQTAITEEGLKTVKRLLKASATRSTAVSCHRVRTRQRTELVWVVGQRHKFNAVGFVPVNRTGRNILLSDFEQGWYCKNEIAICAGIAGLFHDVGKANDLFQAKLNRKIKSLNFEPFRHEWVSLRIFEAFVIYAHSYQTQNANPETNQKTNPKTNQNNPAQSINDTAWLQLLYQFHDWTKADSNHHINAIVQCILMDSPTSTEPFINPFSHLPPIAKLVAWLIVSHHRLPQFNEDKTLQPNITQSNNWLKDNFDYSWNAINYQNSKVTSQHIIQNWQFTARLPLISHTWRKKAHELAKRALRHPNKFHESVSGTSTEQTFIERPFISHLSRLCLMLADHYYSAQEPTPSWQDSQYQAYANTDKQRNYKQHLDEHNLGVAHHAYLLARQLPSLRKELPTLDDDQRILQHGLLTNKSSQQDKQDFGWQDKSYRLACQLQKTADKQGFFGICMASTGKGKTLANARIMSALSDKETGCRFSVALGLRSLTLQTGKALQKLLQVDEMDVATVIGSQAILNLDKPEVSFEEQVLQACAEIGSESLEIGADDYEVDSELEVHEGFLHSYFAGQSKAQKMLQAPILVSTIDHLTPATEGVRGGRQIVPMLRLLTADLVLDEPDEFNEADLPALTRLVHWAGMLGAKVLLSTASMPPDFAYALFDAYQTGRADHHQGTADPTTPMPSVVCAWFDEFTQVSESIARLTDYRKHHNTFSKTRVNNLLKHALPLRQARLISTEGIPQAEPYSQLASLIQSQCIQLHHQHHQTLTQQIDSQQASLQQNSSHHSTHDSSSSQTLSIGLVRFANINPLVAVTQHLYALAVPTETQIHYCVYHSQYPLAQRAHIEKMLDSVLDRHEPEAIWQHESIRTALQDSPATHHLFVVLATSVAEVGRDHDYDWAIAEPSSMRSLVQLAGRIQRHRKQVPNCENYLILDKNIKALQGKSECFSKPGFESTINGRLLHSKNIHDILRPEEYQRITAIPCIQHPKGLSTPSQGKKYQHLVDMEHLAYRQILFGTQHDHAKSAKNWWRYSLDWNAELQRRTPFRHSQADTGYCFYTTEDGHHRHWQMKNEHCSPIDYVQTDDISNVEIAINRGNQPWGYAQLADIYHTLSEQLDKPLSYVCCVYGEVRLSVYDNSINTNSNHWHYHPALGVYRQITHIANTEQAD